jgi:flagellar biosynthesis protein FliR
MPASFSLPAALLWNFLLAMVRVAGLFVFIPLPGAPASPAMARIAATLALAAMLYPFLPAQAPPDWSYGNLARVALAEACLGLTIGLLVGIASECFTFGAQVVSLQAGFSYASTIDPTNQSDTGILSVLSQLMAGLLFFATGLDRLLIAGVAHSFEAVPGGAFNLNSPAAVGIVVKMTGLLFSVGLRYALPVVAVLLLADVALALAARVNAQLQLLAMAFPIKTALCFLAGSAALSLVPGLYQGVAGRLAAAAVEIVRAR